MVSRFNYCFFFDSKWPEYNVDNEIASDRRSEFQQCLHLNDTEYVKEERKHLPMVFSFPLRN